MCVGHTLETLLITGQPQKYSFQTLLFGSRNVVLKTQPSLVKTGMTQKSGPFKGVTQ